MNQKQQKLVFQKTMAFFEALRKLQYDNLPDGIKRVIPEELGIREHTVYLYEKWTYMLDYIYPGYFTHYECLYDYQHLAPSLATQVDKLDANKAGLANALLDYTAEGSLIFERLNTKQRYQLQEIIKKTGLTPIT
jgi:hypothetical protein